MGKMVVKPSKVSPKWASGAVYRPQQGRLTTSFALNKATKALSTVTAADAATQKGNIKVVVRVRPTNSRESTVNAKTVVQVVDSNMVVFDPPDEDGGFYYKGVRQATQSYQSGKRSKDSKFAFDHVYGPQSTTAEIFRDVINPMLDTLLNGYNCSVFAYGSTGSGKTHTMIGNANYPGLTYQTVMELYRRLGQMENEYEMEVTVSYLEVYNETVRDLLNTGSGELQIREDTKGIVVANLTTHKPKDSQALLDLLARGNSFRSQHPTDQNAESSRSHAVFSVYIKLRSRFTKLTNNYKSAKLVMVDLAGSEKGASTGFHGQRFREGASINKSLLSLGNCINALADSKKHIPYRDSKLTRILKDSLGGNCKTVMIANVSPSNLSYEDSYNTLRYADRAKRIKCQVKKNTMSVSACLTQYTKVVEEMSNRIETLERELREARSACRCGLPKNDSSTQMDHDMSQDTYIIQSTMTSVSAPSTMSTITEESFNDVTTNSPSPPAVDLTMTGMPSNIMDRLAEIAQERQTTVKTLTNASTDVDLSSVKIEMKESRVQTIKKLRSKESKSIEKIEKQVKVLRQKQIESRNQKQKAAKRLEALKSEITSFHEKYGSVTNVAIALDEFFELQNLKVEKDRLSGKNAAYKSLSSFYLEEWIKTEHLLGIAAGQLSEQYLMAKHYNHTTKAIESAYSEFVGSLCGKKVQWSNDVDGQGQKQHYLKRKLENSGAEFEDDDIFDLASEHTTPFSNIRSAMINARRGTPPRPPGVLQFSNDNDDEMTSCNQNRQPYELPSLATFISQHSKENIPANKPTSSSEFLNPNLTFVVPSDAEMPDCPTKSTGPFDLNITHTLEAPGFKHV